MWMNANAVALGRLGGFKGGPARSAKLTKDERVNIARLGAIARWSKQQKPSIEVLPKLDMTIRANRRLEAQRLALLTHSDVDVVEQMLFMQTLPAWERLARGLRRSKLSKAATC
jgi:hypothetical protein